MAEQPFDPTRPFRHYHNIGEGHGNIFNPISQKASELPIVDRILEPQTVPHVLEFLVHGRLTSGGQSSHSLLNDEDFSMLMSPPAEWTISNESAPSQALPELMMIAIGSHEDSSGLSLTDKPTHAMKSRIWEGIVPMSDARWVENDLDNLDNHDIAVQLLSYVTSAFVYLNDTDIQTALRNTYNKIYNHLTTWSNHFNGVLQSQGRESIDVPAMWAEFFQDHLTSISDRTHSWVVGHTERLQEQVVAALNNHQYDRELHPAPPPYDAVQWKLTNQMHNLMELAARAEIYIYLPLDGYLGYTAPDRDPSMDRILWSSNVNDRSKTFHTQLKVLSRADLSGNLVDFAVPPNHPLNISTKYGTQMGALKILRKILRGEPSTINPEPWIRKQEWMLQRDQPRTDNTESRCGFVIYRLTHGQSDEQWEQFKNRLNEDIASWTNGRTGAVSFMEKWKLHWINGKDVGLLADDLDAAKDHFQTYRNAEDNKSLFETGMMSSEQFLAVDQAAFTSYNNVTAMTSAPSLPPNMRFIHTIDADFDPAEPGDHAEESPGFTGKMRILGSLVIADLYAMEIAQTQGVGEFWPLAMRSPGEIYMGPIVRAQEEAWGIVDRGYEKQNL